MMKSGTKHVSAVELCLLLTRTCKVVLGAVFVVLLSFGNKALACPGCGCIPPEMAITTDLITQEHADTVQYFEDEIPPHEDLFIFYFNEYLVPSMIRMTEQLSAVAMLQMEAVGTLMDSKQQLETQRLFQELETQAHKDYYPSVGVCTFGTVMKSLAASERYSRHGAFILSQRSQDRQLGNVNSLSSEGGHLDRHNRMEQFREVYCDAHDNHDGLGYTPGTRPYLCDPAPPTDRARMNKDIDYAMTLDSPMTLGLDFCDDPADCTPSLADLTEDEQDIFALASNIYAHELFLRSPEGLFDERAPADLAVKSNQIKYLDLRAVVAKRSVAENSFNVIAAMKAQTSPNLEDGTPPQTFEYMKVLLRELGFTDNDIRDIYTAYETSGEERPSYHAQMEILTKNIFQRPEFYVNLYDKPVNVIRKGVALQAIDLMQDLDTLKSYLRTEAMLSVLLEVEVAAAQKDSDNRISRLRTKGKR
jgi:hypothetical protein